MKKDTKNVQNILKFHKTLCKICIRESSGNQFQKARESDMLKERFSANNHYFSKKSSAYISSRKEKTKHVCAWRVTCLCDKSYDKSVRHVV